MAGPTVATHTSAGFNAASGASSGLNVPSGDAVYVFVFFGQNTSNITSVTDGPGNSYTAAKTFTSANGTVDVWRADNVTGNAALAVTVNLGATRLTSFVVTDITGQANPSYDKAGSGTSGSYTSGTDESDSLSPTNANDLLLFAMGISASQTGTGVPSVTYGAETGETLVDSHSQTLSAAHTNMSGGVYSQAGSGTGSTTLKGKATVTGGTGLSAAFAGILIGILPKPQGGGPLYMAA